MSGLEPTYTNIIKQELEIGDLRRTVALVTGKLERLQQFVDRSEWGQERDRLHVQLDVSKYSNDLLREQLHAQSVTYQDNLTEIQLLKAQVKLMEHATEKDVDRMERAAIQVESLNEECNRLKAQVVSREKEVDTMMAQRNLAEAKLELLERREQGHLSELDDYARTVLHLRSRVKACESEHGLQREQP